MGYFKIFGWRVPLGPILKRKGRDQVWSKNHLRGMPDLQGILRRKQRGRGWFVELKTSKGELRPEQVTWIADLQAAGAACAVVRSLDEFVRTMREWGEID